MLVLCLLKWYNPVQHPDKFSVFTEIFSDSLGLLTTSWKWNVSGSMFNILLRSFCFTNCHNLSNHSNGREKRANKSRKQFPHHFSAPPSSSQPKEEKDSGWRVSQELKLQCHTAFFLFLCGCMGGGGGGGEWWWEPLSAVLSLLPPELSNCFLF